VHIHLRAILRSTTKHKRDVRHTLHAVRAAVVDWGRGAPLTEQELMTKVAPGQAATWLPRVVGPSRMQVCFGDLLMMVVVV
jgi:hypothetical protein